MDEPTDQPVFFRQHEAVHYPYTFAEYLRRFLWEWCQCLLIRPSPRKAYRWRRFWLRRFGAQLTNTSFTRPTTRIIHPWLLTMGCYSTLGDRVEVYNLGPITLGDQTLISQDVTLCAGTHDDSDPTLPLQRPPIVVGDGVWVCAQAFIGPGVTLGRNVVVGARAVVMKDIVPNVVVAGNPARVIRSRFV